LAVKIRIWNENKFNIPTDKHFATENVKQQQIASSVANKKKNNLFTSKHQYIWLIHEAAILCHCEQCA